VLVTDGEGEEKKLAFEYFPAEPKPKAKGAGGEDDDDDGEDEESEGPALVEAAPRKALSAPREKKDRPKSGAVPSIPRRKEE
jgi:hypothetical protein